MKKILAYLLCLAVTACTSVLDGAGDDVSDASADYVNIRTKGTNSRRTYIFYLLGNKNTATKNLEYYGTYLDSAQGDPLIPVQVDEYGVATSDQPASSYGLRASNGGYSLFIASPAVEMSEIAGLKGYHYTRNDEGVYISDPVSVSVGGVYLSDSEGTEYIYDASSQVLRQPRSRLQLCFGCGEGVDVTLVSISLKNFISEGYYIPIEKRFHFTEEKISQEQQLYPPEGGNPRFFTGGEVENLNVDEYILSMNYGEKDAEGKVKFPMPSLKILIKSGATSADVVELTAALGWDFKPQNAYEFTVIINSAYVSVQVKAFPWNPVENSSSTVDETETWKIEFPLTERSVNLLDWEKVDKQVGTIS